MDNKKDLETQIEQETAHEKDASEANPDTLNIGYLIELQNQNNELQQNITQLKEDILRLKAESDNLRKRYEKQIAETKDFSISVFAKDLLGIMDNINRALLHLPENIDDSIKNVIIGVEMTKKELENVFSRHNIVVINPQIGEIFDHNLHNVISQIESKEHTTGTVIDVPQTGYRLKERLLRPASVVVAKDIKNDN
jgi:molecular chaperone GrpE